MCTGAGVDVPLGPGEGSAEEGGPSLVVGNPSRTFFVVVSISLFVRLLWRPNSSNGSTVSN